MPALVFMAANVSSDMEESWTAFTLALLWIVVIQFLQYIYAYMQNKNSEKDRKLIRDFFQLLFVGMISIIVSLFLSGIGRILLTGFGFIVIILGAIFFRKDMARVPINMPHLIERLYYYPWGNADSRSGFLRNREIFVLLRYYNASGSSFIFVLHHGI